MIIYVVIVKIFEDWELGIIIIKNKQYKTIFNVNFRYEINKVKM